MFVLWDRSPGRTPVRLLHVVRSRHDVPALRLLWDVVSRSPAPGRPGRPRSRQPSALREGLRYAGAPGHPRDPVL